MIDCQITSYIRGANPVWSMVDLDGNQADDTFWLWVLENTIPYQPSTQVFRDAAGTVQWTSPIQFLANGTLPIDIYYANNTVYRLEIRKSNGITPPTQADPLIYLIEDYNPGNSIDFPDNVEGDATDNQIANGQFSAINFVSPLVLTAITNPPPINIAPGWDLVLSGTGSVTIEQIPLNNALSNPTNAPYALRINTSGWTNQPYLRQRFQQNGMNWAGKYLSGSLTGRITGGSQIVQMQLFASNGAPLASIVTAALSNNFTQYQGFALLAASTNADLPPNAYLDCRIILPTTGEVFLTSFQIIASDSGVNIPYQQDSIDRQLDHLAHYYKPQLAYKPIPSYLVGWDFPVNPAQFFGDSVGAQAVGAGKSFYAWDQTIVFQAVNNGITVSRDADTKGIKLTAAIAGQCAIIQYIEEAQARELLEGNMAVYVNGYTSAALGLNATVTLWATADAALPDLKTPNFNSAISALAANGRPTMANGNWTEIPRGNLGDAVFELAPPISELNFNGWTLTNTTSTALRTTTKYMAIVIGFETMALNDTITINSVGLCAGDMATKPAPKSLSEAQIECNRFYWKSFNPGVAPAQNVGLNTGEYRYPVMQVDAGDNYSSSIIFPAPMTGIPLITFYNPAAANALARNISVPGDAAATTTVGCNVSRGSFNIYSQGVAGWTIGMRLAVHVTADSRLGVVL